MRSHQHRVVIAAITIAGMVVAMAGLQPALAADVDPPVIEVNVSHDQISGWNWNAGDPITVSIDDQTFTGDPGGDWGSFDFNGDSWTFYGQGSIDVRADQTVRASDTSHLKTLVVADLRITGYDLGASTISGSTNVASAVHVNAWHPADQDWDSEPVTVTPSAGTWTATITSFALRVTDQAEAQQFEDGPGADGDSTLASAVLAGPRFTFGIEIQEVVGLDWPAGHTVTLSIDRPSTTANPDWTGSTSPVPQDSAYTGWIFTGDRGTVYFDLTATTFQARPGDTMTMSNATTSKSMLVPALTTRLPDRAASVLFGTTTLPAGSFLIASSDAWWNAGVSHEATVGSGGQWSVSFEADGVSLDGMPYAYQTDADGDVTESHAPVPDIRVDPTADRVWAPDFGTEPGHGSVALSISRSGTTVLTRTVSATNVLTRGSWNLDMWVQRTGTLPRPTVALYDLKGTFDIRGGDHVTVTDGVSTRELDVASLTVDAVDAVTDVISGQATETVSLHLGEGEGGYWGYQTEPVAGRWSYQFDPNVWPNPPEGLVPGMTGQALVYPGTVVRWTVPEPVTAPSQLVASVRALHLKASVERSLVSILQSAQQSYDRHRDRVGNTQMTAFIVVVRALTPRTIPSVVSQRLIADARSVITAHGG